MTPQSIIRRARDLTQDVSEPYRNSDEEMLNHVNDGLREMVIVQPALFSGVIEYTCSAGVEQEISKDVALTIFEVLGLSDGPAVHPFDVDVMNVYNRGWRSESPAPAEQWARLTNDPLRFYVYPPSLAGQVLDVRVVKKPQAITSMTAPITTVSEIYESALTDYVVYRAESKDDEHVLSERAAAHYQAFVSKVKG